MKLVLKISILFFVILALLFLLGGKDKIASRKYLYNPKNEQGYFAGDLYNYAEIDKYKERVRLQHYEGKQAPQDGEIIAFGDSFMNNGFDSATLPVMLGERLGKKVVFYQPPVNSGGPLEYLERNNYQKGAAKFFVWESVERKAVIRAKEYVPKKIVTESTGQSVAKKTPVVALESKLSRLNFLIFDRVDVEFFIKNNFIIKPFRIFLKNLAYNLFGEMDKKTATYSTDPPMLFFDEEMAFNADKGNVGEQNINIVADDIAMIGKELKEKYNLDLIYMVIPNKYSVYHDYIKNGPAYNDFIPSLQSALASRGVSYVDSYGRFLQYRKDDDSQLLYFVGDTHFNSTGKEMSLQALIEKIHYLSTGK